MVAARAAAALLEQERVEAAMVSAGILDADAASFTGASPASLASQATATSQASPASPAVSADVSQSYEPQLALQIPYVPIAEHYALGLTYDRGETESIVRQDLLNKWDMQFGEALSIAFANLSEESEYPFELVAPGVYMAPPGMDHNPAKLLLTDRIAYLPFKGLPVAIAPHLNQVVIAGSEDVIGLKLLLKIAEDLQKTPHGVLSLPMVLSENNWYPFSLLGDHELFAAFDGHRLKVMSNLYKEQKVLLEKIYAGSEPPVAILDYIERNIDDQSYSQSIVNEADLPALMPLSDCWEFRRMDEGSPLKRVATGNLDRCVKYLAESLIPAGLYPERCRLEKFPDRKQQRQIGLDGYKNAYERYDQPAADPKRVVEEVLLLPIYPNSRPKGDSKEYNGRFTMDFLSADSTAEVSRFYFYELNKQISTCLFNFHLCKAAVLEPHTHASQALMSSMLADHYTGRIPAENSNPMPTPDTYLLADETQTVSRAVSLIRAQNNGTVINLSKKAYNQEELQTRIALPITDLEALAGVFGIPIHEGLVPQGACLNETHSVSQSFSLSGVSLKDLALFYLSALKLGSYLTSTSSQFFLEAVRPTETVSVHIGKGVIGEPFMQLKRKFTSNIKPQARKTDQLLDLEKRLSVELYADSAVDGRLLNKDKLTEQKFVTRENPQSIARFFRCVMEQPVFVPLEDHRPNCWLVQSFALRKAGESVSILIMAQSERTAFVVRTMRA